MLHLSKQHHVHTMSPSNQPCLTLPPGERIRLETWDALEGSLFSDHHAAGCQAEANPATGPILIETARPGDALVVEIHLINLHDRGYLHFKPAMIRPEATGKSPQFVEMGISNNQIAYAGRTFPADPMIGVIGTAPLTDVSCLEAGAHGGNMDCRLIRAGCKVLLPVFVPGALLALGDIHALMGDGEVFGQGIEAGADIELTVHVLKGKHLASPIVIDCERIACVASALETAAAADLALAGLGQYLIRELSWPEHLACAALAFYGHLVICQKVNRQITIRMEMLWQDMQQLRG